LLLGPTAEETVAQFVLRIAFSDSLDDDNPVLQGVFALASLQLHGSDKAFDYKRRVMSIVAKSSERVDEKTMLQNLMGLMLLYHYEVRSSQRRCPSLIV
jgi:hypothetical protein